jgi:S-layer homology domain.
MPVYSNGEEIVYTVTEDAVKGYEATSIEETEPGVWSITNEKQSTPFEDPTNPTEPVRPDPTPALNTKDHYAYIIGYPDGTVRPNGTITRAETVTIFFRMLTDASRDAVWSTENSFTDVKAADWFNNAISTMENGGIINGYPDGSFNPNGKITRAEFAAMAIRFFQDAKVGPSKFSDTIGHWAEEAIDKALEQGLITGYPDGTFRPDQPITRAEAMTIVNRVLKRAPHKDHLLPERDMITWPDNMDKTVWYYADVQEATNSHEYTMNGEYENWERELPVRDWEAFEKMWSNAHSASNPGEVIGD